MDRPPMWELPIEETRRSADAAAAFMSPGGPEPVAGVANCEISGRNGPIGVRVYTPTSGGPHGILVYYHGGGYVLCSLETHDGLCRRLCNLGDCVVVSVDYRLAPEHPFPAGVTDAIDATMWVQDHAKELGGDPERMAVGGDSAGGNFAAVVALGWVNGDDWFNAGASATTGADRPPFKLQVLLYPGTDRKSRYASLVDNAQGYLLTTEMRDWFQACYVPPDADLADWRLSPMHAPSHRGLRRQLSSRLNTIRCATRAMRTPKSFPRPGSRSSTGA